MGQTEKLADLIERYAAQLRLHLPPGGDQPNFTYGGYSDQVPQNIGRDRLVELAPAIVACSEAVKNLSAARSNTPPLSAEGDVE